MQKTGSSRTPIFLLFLAAIALCAGAQSQQSPPASAVSSTGSIVPGTPISITTTTPGQTVKLTFTGKAGEHVSLVLSKPTYSSKCVQCSFVLVSILRPDGVPLGMTSLGNASATSPAATVAGTGFLDSLNLPLNGTYTLVAAPQQGITGSVTATLYLFNDLVETIKPGVAQAVTTTIPGQNVRLMFNGSAGQRAGVSVTDSTYGSCAKCNAVAVRIHGSPVAAALSSTTLSASATTASVNSVTLPATGTYSIVVDPQGGRTGSAVVTLSLE